jgi:hypothetical protein
MFGYLPEDVQSVILVLGTIRLQCVDTVRMGGEDRVIMHKGEQVNRRRIASKSGRYKKNKKNKKKKETKPKMLD